MNNPMKCKDRGTSFAEHVFRIRAPLQSGSVKEMSSVPRSFYTFLRTGNSMSGGNHGVVIGVNKLFEFQDFKTV